MRDDGSLSARRAVAAATIALLPVAHTARAQAPVVSIPIQYEDARIYVPVRVGDGAPRWFILDTGAQPTLVDERVATSAGIPVTYSTSTTGAGGRTTRIGFARDITLTVGSIPLALQRVTVAPLDSVLAPSTGRPIPGIVGSRFFMEHVVEIDVGRGTIRVYEPSTFAYRGHGIIVPVDLSSDVPYATGWIAMRSATDSGRFLLDLGAKANALVTEHFAKAHRLAQRAPASVVTEFGAGMGGETSYRFVRTGAMGLAPDARTRIDSLIVGLSAGGTLTSPGYDVLLGAQYLTRFRIILDYPRHRVILEPRTHAGARDELDMSGLFVIAPDALHRSVVVKSIRVRSPAAIAGVRSGDVVTAIDELSGSALTVATARERLRSRDGRSVTVQVERDGAAHRFTMVLKRAI